MTHLSSYKCKNAASAPLPPNTFRHAHPHAQQVSSSTQNLQNMHGTKAIELQLELRDSSQVTFLTDSVHCLFARERVAVCRKLSMLRRSCARALAKM